MTDQDKQDIAAILTSVLAQHPAACPHGIDADTAASLKAFAEAVRIGKKTIYKTILASIAAAILGAIILGIRELIIKK